MTHLKKTQSLDIFSNCKIDSWISVFKEWRYDAFRRIKNFPVRIIGLMKQSGVAVFGFDATISFSDSKSINIVAVEGKIIWKCLESQDPTLQKFIGETETETVPWCQRTPNYANFLNPFRENS